MVDVQRICYITAAFGSLRGLRRLPFGGYYVLGALYEGWVIPSASHGASLYPLWPAVAALPFVALLLTALVDLYYRRAFGSVVARAPAPKAAPFSRAWLWVPVWVGFALLVGLNHRAPSPAAVRWLALVGYPALLIGACAAHARTPGASGPIPLAPIVVAMLVLVLFPGFGPVSGAGGSVPHHPGLNNAVAQDLILATFFIGSGLYNHAQLTRTLRRVAEDVRGRARAAV